MDDDPASADARRLRLLIDGLPALIGYWDRDARNVVANQSYVEYFGMTPAEIRGRHISEVLGEDVYALNLPYIEGVLAGTEQLFERTLVDQYGRTRYTQASYIPDIVDGEVCGFYAQVTDVTARVEAEQARDDAVRMYQISIANAPFGSGVFDTDGRTLQANPALCQLLACAESDLVGVDFRRFIHPDEFPDVEVELDALVHGPAQSSTERRYVRLDGATVWMQRNAVLVPGAHGVHDVIVAQFQDVTARRRAEAELARWAVTDSLTGLHNRYALDDFVRQRLERQPSAPIGVVFADLDGFKDVNDDHGHAVGDAVLAHAAKRLATVIEAPNVAYRLGGDEFVVVVPSPESSLSVAAVAEAMRRVLTGTYHIGGTSLMLEVSVGSTYGPVHNIENLLRVADGNMYRHKLRRRAHRQQSDMRTSTG
ncbi:MAG: diguanylate cyclase domain-containing protein [Mycobacterium sp.]